MVEPSPLATTAQARLQEWSNIHAQLLWSYRAAVHPAGRNAHARTPYLFAWLLRRGSCVTTCARGERRAVAGEWILPPTPPRHPRFSAGARIISVAFRLDWPGGQSLYDHGTGLVLPAHDFPQLEQTADALDDYLEREFPMASNQLFLQPSTVGQHWELHYLFAAWLRAYTQALEQFGVAPTRPREDAARLATAQQVIERHALHLPFRETELALEVGLSVPHLNRLFARHLGMTPGKRFEERRKQAALALVEQSQRPLKAISADLGFHSPAHFSRWFTQHLRTSPREYRRHSAPTPATEKAPRKKKTAS